MLTEEKRKEILRKLGVIEQEIEKMLEYTANKFSYNPSPSGEEFLFSWLTILNIVEKDGVARAINRHLVRSDLQIDFKEPERVKLEIFDSFAGKIPIISTYSDEDFESLVQNIVFKDKPYPHLKAQGAQFVFGRNNQFIILSHKPYSNTPAESLGLEDELWREKSYTIRKYHECAHLYTKQKFGSARNNLHDELIADFCGIWTAFSEYRVEWFTKFLAQGRLKIYVEGLSLESAAVIEKLANLAAAWIGEWTKTASFAELNEIERINFLCEKELLTYAS